MHSCLLVYNIQHTNHTRRYNSGTQEHHKGFISTYLHQLALGACIDHDVHLKEAKNKVWHFEETRVTMSKRIGVKARSETLDKLHKMYSRSMNPGWQTTVCRSMFNGTGGSSILSQLQAMQPDMLQYFEHMKTPSVQLCTYAYNRKVNRQSQSRSDGRGKPQSAFVMWTPRSEEPSVCR